MKATRERSCLLHAETAPPPQQHLQHRGKEQLQGQPGDLSPTLRIHVKVGENQLHQVMWGHTHIAILVYTVSSRPARTQ